MPMTKQQRRAEARRQNAIIASHAAPLKAWIAQEKNRFIRATAAHYRRYRHMDVKLLHEHESKIKGLLHAHYLRVGRAMNRDIAATLPARKSAKPPERKEMSRFEFLLRQWATDNAGAKAKPIAGTTQDDINNAVQLAYQSDEPEADVISAIMGVMGYSDFRADAIARTETHNAAMYASITTVEDFADDEDVVMLKNWTPVEDDRTRDYHADMDDYGAIPLDEDFELTDDKGIDCQMNRPGDQDGPANQVINCRCVLTYEAQ